MGDRIRERLVEAGVWGDEQDIVFLNELKFARKYVPLHREPVVEPILFVIRNLVSQALNRLYSVEFLYELFNDLQTRFELFEFVIGFPFVRYDPQTNLVTMPGQIKMSIKHLKPAADRYFEIGEPLWEDLKFLFLNPLEVAFEQPGVLHPPGRIDRMNYVELPMDPTFTEERRMAIAQYCDIFNGIYRIT